jgi:hypothetical protein
VSKHYNLGNFFNNFSLPVKRLASLMLSLKVMLVKWSMRSIRIHPTIPWPAILLKVFNKILYSFGLQNLFMCQEFVTK